MKGRHVKTHMELRDEALARAKVMLDDSLGHTGMTEASSVARAQVEATMALTYAIADLHGTVLKVAFDIGAIARER